MTVTAKLFTSDRSQAIRLPEQVGNALWVQPARSPDHNMAVWLKSFYSATEALPDNFLADRGDGTPQTCDRS